MNDEQPSINLGQESGGAEYNTEGYPDVTKGEYRVEFYWFEPWGTHVLGRVNMDKPETHYIRVGDRYSLAIDGVSAYGYQLISAAYRALEEYMPTTYSPGGCKGMIQTMVQEALKLAGSDLSPDKLVKQIIDNTIRKYDRLEVRPETSSIT